MRLINETYAEAPSNAHAFMLRRDGAVIPVSIHPYGFPETDGIEETLEAGEWLFENTNSDRTRHNIIRLFATFAEENKDEGETRSQFLSRWIKTQKPKPVQEKFLASIRANINTIDTSDLDTCNTVVIRCLNNEFCRVRFGGLQNSKSGSKEVSFRISSDNGFNWFDVIYLFVHDYKNKLGIKSVTIVTDEESRGEETFYSYKGEVFNQMPVEDFLTLSGNPVVEKWDVLDHVGLVSFDTTQELLYRLGTIKELKPGKTYQLAANGYGVDIFWDETNNSPDFHVTKFGRMIYNKKCSVSPYEWKKVLSDIIKLISEDERLNETFGYHYGDLNVAKKADRRAIMGGRGTGHFGTGFYMVGFYDPKKSFDYGKRACWEIDLDKYNLFKPKSNSEAYHLHDALKELNGWDGKDPEVPSFDVIQMEIDEIVEKYLTVTFEDIENYYHVDSDKAYDMWLKDEYDEDKFITPDKKKKAEEEIIKLLNEYGFGWYVEHKGIDIERLGILEDDLRRMIDDAKYDRELLSWAINTLNSIFGKDVENIARKACSSLDQEDSKSTVFMKLLGYEGIDVTHLNKDGEGLRGPDNFTYGSVIYDLKPGTYKQIKEKDGE